MEIILQKEGDKLNREVYTFYFQNEFHLVLDRYSLETRPTPRHKFQIVKSYSRLDNRNYKAIKEEDVVLNDVIIELAKKQLYNQVRVHKWNDGRG